MQITDPTNQRIKALLVRATEIKQTSDHCSGHSETWSEVNFDAFAKMFVEECITIVEREGIEGEQGVANVEDLKTAMRVHFGLQ
ncbi:MAG: hypothetical protein Q7K57_03255 [Burkholderiaceae bacterium]|uniref:hypothetical protein n=1 Tax=Rhodoferax sp. TaxID=50421 RepID=UPI001ECB8F8C|nr:hypothetical protein [Rhodoferax sp.]MBT9505005.1 hypothetical protein [Rhodoferax sp.]MDO8767720.1 hypothetical protein [Burkholderiaceae bacterium]MDO9236162.1 hypothetical protein [Aquabacterium sp.]